MDSFLLPSVYEGLGFVLIEAVCSGLTCVASDAVPKEARVCGRVEVFSLEGSKEALAARILEHREDASQRKSWSRDLAQLGYGADSLKKRLEDIYSGRDTGKQED